MVKSIVKHGNPTNWGTKAVDVPNKFIAGKHNANPLNILGICYHNVHNVVGLMSLGIVGG